MIKTNPLNVNYQLQHSFDNNGKFVIAAFYKFVEIQDKAHLKQNLQNQCLEVNILGSILISEEGINGTIAAPLKAIQRILYWLQSDNRFENLSIKFSKSDSQPFLRLKVRLKKEIVTMGCPHINPEDSKGIYVEPSDWNNLISDPDVMVIDTRNSYETAIGMFDGAIDPDTKNFRDFPKWASELAKLPPTNRPKKLAMYCTGGIRCEKATALMQEFGFEEVYHLKGGILKYLEQIAPEKSKWKGECFVFDGRVAIDHHLRQGSYKMCHACRMPLSQNDIKHRDYKEGISCSHCKPMTNAKRTARFTERQRQIKLALERGEKHLGNRPKK